MKNFHILLIVLFGFLLMPTSTIACENNSKKKSCDKEMSSSIEKKDCCDNNSHSNGKNHNGCNGKCGHALCSSTSVNIGITSAIQFEIQDDIFNFSTEKQKFHQSVSITSAGYSSIWLIPKIG